MSDIATSGFRSRLRKFLHKSPRAMLISAAWNVRNFFRNWLHKAYFSALTWSPRGPVPCFLAYYPESIRSFPNLPDLYRRWIRGNKKNNNGDAPRFMALVLNLRQLQSEALPGDFAELGVWKGNSAAILADFAAQSGRRLFLFDTFYGFDQRDLVGSDQVHPHEFSDTSIDYVRETVGHQDLTTYITGFFPGSVTEEAAQASYALVHIDCDLYQPMKAALAFFYPRMPKGGMMILHDYSSGLWEGAAQAIDEFCASSGEFVALWPDKSGTAMIRKSR
jgi:hypothetical protein